MSHKLVLNIVTEIKFCLVEEIVYTQVYGGLLRLNWSGFL
jgi:hypothetical protein